MTRQSVWRWLKFYDRAVVVLVSGFLLWSGIRTGWIGSTVSDKPIVATVQTSEASHTVAPAQDVEQKPQPHIKPDYILPAASEGSIPVLNRIPTEEKVVFLTLDDGLVRKPETQEILQQYGIKAPMFLNDEYVKAEPPYFKKLLQQGMTIGSHTVDHADLTTLEYDAQVTEICTNADTIERELGVQPTLFRPPYGSYDANTVRAAAACGMRALVMWSAKANGGSMQYQDDHTGLVPGDIVLMHFREEFADDFKAFMEAAEQADLQPVSLDEWLRTDTTAP